jgi:uncharacterized protein
MVLMTNYFNKITAAVLLLFCVVSFSQPTKSNDSLQNAIKIYRDVFWNDLPKPVGYINDYEALFSVIEKIQLDIAISSFEKETSTEIAILTIDTVKVSKEKFGELATRFAKEWGIGKKGKDNGVLIAISTGHKRVQIVVGDGLQQIISNDEASEIITTYFIPEFKKGNYFSGTQNGLEAIIEIIRRKTK